MSNDRRTTIRRRPKKDPKARAQELHEQGMPFQMAMAVAHGKLDLSEALERMARSERVDRIVQEHDIDRALAMQIALGQADLDAVLAKRAFQDFRSSNRDRTILEIGSELEVLTHDGAHKGAVTSVEPYLVRLEHKSGTTEIHKLQMKAAWAASNWKQAKKAMRVDKAIRKLDLQPIPRPQDRYGCSDRRLFRYHRKGTEVEFTLLQGEVFRGTIAWFSQYEVGLSVRGDVEVVVFRHAFHHVGRA